MGVCITIWLLKIHDIGKHDLVATQNGVQKPQGFGLMDEACDLGVYSLQVLRFNSLRQQNSWGHGLQRINLFRKACSGCKNLVWCAQAGLGYPIYPHTQKKKDAIKSPICCLSLLAESGVFAMWLDTHLIVSSVCLLGALWLA